MDFLAISCHVFCFYEKYLNSSKKVFIKICYFNLRLINDTNFTSQDRMRYRNISFKSQQSGLNVTCFCRRFKLIFTRVLPLHLCHSFSFLARKSRGIIANKSPPPRCVPINICHSSRALNQLRDSTGTREANDKFVSHSDLSTAPVAKTNYKFLSCRY